MARRVPYLGHILRIVLLCLAVHACRVYGQTASLLATAVPLSNVYEAYFGDGQSTIAIGNRLPICLGGTDGVANLSLKLENNVTNQIIQQTAITSSFGGVNWNTAQFPTLLSTLSGRYVCTVFSSSVMVTDTRTYQLNVVVPMNITCTFPHNLNLFYNSMNMLSCNVTGYPQPMVSWSGINQTIPGNKATLSIGTTHVTSTASFEGKDITPNAGDFVTINITAQYPLFTCTSLQNQSAQMNFCDAIPRSVTYSRTLRVVGGCPAFDNTSWSPSTSPVADYQTRLNISCASGYTGSSISVFCQIDGSWTTFPTCSGIDECLSMPCQNGGTCVNEVNRYSCLCKPGYTGQTCETGIDECVSMPCRNNGTCMDEVNRYSCQCKPGYTGLNCETCIDECVSMPCKNGGTCVNEVNRHSCLCPPGYTGQKCETRIDECLSMPCQNGGTCVNEVNRYSCLCKPGYTGQTCETGIDECLYMRCQNGGTCVNEVNRYSCLCKPGYTGQTCETAVECPGTNSVGLTAGVGCGAFFLGSIIASLITWFLAKRKYGTDQTGNCHDPQVGKPPDVVTMTNSDAYGMVDIPTTQQQQPQYEYILPEAQ